MIVFVFKAEAQLCLGVAPLPYMADRQWRSLQGRKAHWSEQEVCTLASALNEALPSEAKSLLRMGRFKGGDHGIAMGT
jgi:hypothetical protein